MDRIEKIAQFMLDQHKSQQNFQNLPQTLMPENFEEAYETQKIFQKNSGRGELGGFKIALASKVQQELCGIDHPIAGGIFANEIKTSPAIFELENFHGLGLEFELAVTLSDDLKPGMEPFDKDNIKQFIKSLSPAFELIIDRNADYSNISEEALLNEYRKNQSALIAATSAIVHPKTGFMYDGMNLCSHHDILNGSWVFEGDEKSDYDPCPKTFQLSKDIDEASYVCEKYRKAEFNRDNGKKIVCYIDSYF